MEARTHRFSPYFTVVVVVVDVVVVVFPPHREGSGVGVVRWEKPGSAQPEETEEKTTQK